MSLHDDLTKLAQEHPETREHLIPLLRKQATDATHEMEYMKYKSWIMAEISHHIPAYLKDHETEFKEGTNKTQFVNEIRQLWSAIDKAAKAFIGEV